MNGIEQTNWTNLLTYDYSSINSHAITGNHASYTQLHFCIEENETKIDLDHDEDKINCPGKKQLICHLLSHFYEVKPWSEMDGITWMFYPKNMV